MFIFQLLASVFIIFVLNRVVKKYHEKRLPKSEVLVWFVFWLLLTLAIWWPKGTDILAQALGVTRGADLIMAASIAAIFYLLFKVFAQLYQLQREVTLLTRKLSHKEHDEEYEHS